MKVYCFLKKVKGVFSRIFVLPAMKREMEYCGKNVGISTDSVLTLNTLSVGDRSYIGPRAVIVSTCAKCRIGNDVMLGPGVTIITGNHRTDIVGRTMRSLTDADKRPEDDEDVVIENDCWIGANATILKGVTIGEGSIVAAGAVVTKSTPPYSILGGVPAKVISMRFSEEEIARHKTLAAQQQL